MRRVKQTGKKRDPGGKGMSPRSGAGSPGGAGRVEARQGSIEGRSPSKRGISKKEWAALAPVLAAAAILLFFNLGAKYLWQDEAFTAVLAARMIKYGKPLSYDGTNLLTLDLFDMEDASTVDNRTGAPEAAIRYYVDRKDFRKDTTWTANPWGQLVFAGASVALFGRNALAARAPFAAAALLTVVLLYVLVRRCFDDPLIAWLAAAMLVANVYWVIHSRQCRYYSLSGLFLMLTLIAFMRWQSGRPFGRALFVLSGWCFFQMEYGSFWPVTGVLLVAAALASRRRILSVLLVGAILGASIAPWVWYYGLADRLHAGGVPWASKFLLNLFHMNQFLIAMVVLLGAVAVLRLRWRALAPAARMMLSVSLAILFTALVWVPSVTPYAFHRFIVHLSPLAALVTAWMLCEGAALVVVRLRRREIFRCVLAGAAAAFLVVFPFVSNTVAYPLQKFVRTAPTGDLLRPEWSVLAEEVFTPREDPNRKVIEALRPIIAPGDEILVNYEDVPLMFYTDNPVRGGVPCFRVEDRSKPPPRFLIYRRSVTFVHTAVFEREIRRYRWRIIHTGAADVPWGNIPEPGLRPPLDSSSFPEVIVAENMGPAGP